MCTFRPFILLNDVAARACMTATRRILSLRVALNWQQWTTGLALLLIAAFLVPKGTQAASALAPSENAMSTLRLLAEDDEPCPQAVAPTPPIPPADSTEWVQHAQELRHFRECTSTRTGTLFVQEATAWVHAGRLRAASDLGMRILQTPARSDSAGVSRVLHIAGTAASLDSRPDESTHLFRTASYYLSSRPVVERVDVYVEWAEASIRRFSMQDARDHLNAARRLAASSPNAVPSELRALIPILEAWTYILPALRDETSPPRDAAKALNVAQEHLDSADKVVWTSASGQEHHVGARYTATQSALRWLQKDSVTLTLLHEAHREADATGDHWGALQAGFVKSLVHLRHQQTADAYSTLDDAVLRSRTAPEPALLPHLLLADIRVAAAADDTERARASLSTLSRLAFVPPPLFQVASTTVMTSFDDGWTGSTWVQILALSLVLSVGFQLLAAHFSWNLPPVSPSATDADAGSDEPPMPAPKDDSSAYQSPHGLQDPRINRHATVSFDTYITLDPEEIATIIEATPFTTPESSSREDDVPDPNAESQNAPDGDGRNLGREDGNEIHTGTGRVEVPCYLPDGTRRDPVDLPVAMTRDLMERRIIALEVDGEILVLYRFKTGTQRVVHYDPDTESFTDLDLDDTFHGFPIARLDQPPT